MRFYLLTETLKGGNSWDSTYWLSCSNITEALIISFLCTGPMLIPAYWKSNDTSRKIREYP